MPLSRRDWSVLLPALAAAGARAQSQGLLPGRVYHSGAIRYTGDSRKKGREFFHGATHTGFRLEMHETILGPEVQTHAPHHHVYEEIVIVVEGTMEVLIQGRTEPAEAGSVIYFASNQMHSARNAGATPCRYYVVELRGGAA